MYNSKNSARKYVISSALIASLAFSPAVNERVFAKVDSESIPQEESSKSTVEHMELWDTGQEVTSLQSDLKELGYYTYHLDGSFGPITEAAVKAFQSDQGLKVDGLAGPKTMAALDDITSDSNETETASQSEIVSTAKSLIGTPYVWGGTTPEGFDSSGFIQYVFAQTGIDLSRTERDMWKYDGVTVDSPSIGDVVFFEGTYDVNGASHSGIYIGDNKIIHAGSDGVEITDLNYDYWQNHYLGVKSFD
ncbi:NlpC/P60 family protein [Thalassobacillus pellis]|uniref:C40 family peptidase n=1 Tax=Thalassobacillus pellis TaxID=748008 RepID=UPI00195F71FA|nr:NlpC/P60 family protein [Thalassobacillus pellis]MBM7552094.1 peptidoglycan hydrolase-like protein with peptidoglycan-binding domain [Thalassobacillus pellis]